MYGYNEPPKQMANQARLHTHPVTQMIPMRDGVSLAVDVFAQDAPCPVILHRTPYDRTATSLANVTAADATPQSPARIAAFYRARGFHYVTQDCRGRNGSEGDFVKYVSDGTDGFDTCAWIVAQDWCDGRILTTGLSYDAHLQATLGMTDPPGPCGQVLDCGGLWNGWKSGLRTNGAFEMKQATWAVAAAQKSPEALAEPDLLARLTSGNLSDWLTKLPWTPGNSPLAEIPSAEAALLEQWTEGPFSDYWRDPGLWFEGFHSTYPKVPVVHLSGWYDPYLRRLIRWRLSRLKKLSGKCKSAIGPRSCQWMRHWFEPTTDARIVMAVPTAAHRMLNTVGTQERGPVDTAELPPPVRVYRHLRFRRSDRWRAHASPLAKYASSLSLGPVARQ